MLVSRCIFSTAFHKIISLSVIRTLLFQPFFSFTTCEITSNSLFTPGVIHALALSMSRNPAFGIKAGSKTLFLTPRLIRSSNCSSSRFELIAALVLLPVSKVVQVFVMM